MIIKQPTLYTWYIYVDDNLRNFHNLSKNITELFKVESSKKCKAGYLFITSSCFYVFQKNINLQLLLYKIIAFKVFWKVN